MALNPEHLIVGVENLADVDEGGVVTCADEVATLPASNLQTKELGDAVLRTQSVDPANTRIVATLRDQLPWNAVMLHMHNFTDGATVRLQADNAGTFASPVYDSDTDGGVLLRYGESGFERNMALVLTSVDVTAQYLRLLIADASNPAGYLQAARLGVFLGWQPSLNFPAGVEFPLASDDQEERTAGGATYTDVAEWRRSVVLDLREMTRAEAAAVTVRLARKGRSGDLLVVPFPSDPSTWYAFNVWGPFSDVGSIRMHDSARWGRQLSVQERVKSR